MDLDDSKDKLRKNLLIFSFLIVVSNFLSLDFQSLGKLSYSLNLYSVSHFKLWLVIFVTLIYFFYRYWFDDKTSATINALKSEYESKRYKFLRKAINRDITQSLLGLRKPKLLLDFKGLDDPNIALHNKNHGRPVRALSIASPNITSYDPDYGSLIPDLRKDKGWVGTVSNDFFMEWEGNHFGTRGGASTEFRITPLYRFSIRIKSLVNLLLYSKSISEFIVPISLFICATSICIYNLFLSSLSRPAIVVCWV